MRRVVVLRLGHRCGRDLRVSTHLALVARAFGADQVVFVGADRNVENALAWVNQKFGALTEFCVRSDWENLLRTWEGLSVHLTMYGLRIDDVIGEIRRHNDILVVVGAEKVPRRVYELADYNVAVSCQPHSEVAALAIFLDRLFGGQMVSRNIGGEKRILPSARGKHVVDNRTPGRQYCFFLLEKHKCPSNVIKHVQAVEKLAVKIAIEAKADVELVSAGALLHDIGRAYTHGIDHGVRGAEVLRAEGLPEYVVSLVENHVGAGIRKEEAIKLGLPPKHYVPRTLEEKIVAHADNLIDHDRKVPIGDVVSRLKTEKLYDVAARVLRLHEELSTVCGIDLDML